MSKTKDNRAFSYVDATVFLYYQQFSVTIDNFVGIVEKQIINGEILKVLKDTEEAELIIMIWNMTLNNIEWINKNAESVSTNINRGSTIGSTNFSELTKIIRKTILDDIQVNPHKWTKYFEIAKLFLK